MNTITSHTQTLENSSGLSWGHFSAVLVALVLLLGATWMKQPELFSLHKQTNVASDENVPRYYAYQAPAENSMPLVAGANTNDGPSVINEDGTVSQVDMGQVLGASTQDVQLSLDDIKVISIPDSQTTVAKYFSDINKIETSPIDNSEFENALSSGNQKLIDAQAQKLSVVKDQLVKLPTPQSLVKLNKLKIIQYNSAIGVLQNFTSADSNPELVGKYLQEFLKSQQDLDDESALVEKKLNLTDTQIYNAQ